MLQSDKSYAGIPLAISNVQQHNYIDSFFSICNAKMLECAYEIKCTWTVINVAKFNTAKPTNQVAYPTYRHISGLYGKSCQSIA